jgi:hypothetical protein
VETTMSNDPEPKGKFRRLDIERWVRLRFL